MSGCLKSSPARDARSVRTSAIFTAKGRAETARSCARFSFAAETIFMAFVICCVFLTDLMRRRMSRRLAITQVQNAECGMMNDESHAVFNSSFRILHSSFSLCPGCGGRLRGRGRAGRSLRRAGRLGLRVERGLFPSLLEV